MTKTILITGTSTGIGRATVKCFSTNGWQVAATMRHPELENEMQSWKGVKVYKLDVTNTASIERAIKEVTADFGNLDVICNNAGYGAVGIFEKSTEQQIHRQFETNVFGCMNVIRSVLPHFRKNKKGIIINITSMGGLITFPLYSLYHSTKWAMEGFSESLAFELKPLGIMVKCIEPGAIQTDFNSRSQELFMNDALTDYASYEQATFANIQTQSSNAANPEIVAKTIYKAATDGRSKLRYAVGGIGPLLLFMRRLVPEKWFFGIIKMVVEKGFKK